MLLLLCLFLHSLASLLSLLLNDYDKMFCIQLWCIVWRERVFTVPAQRPGTPSFVNAIPAGMETTVIIVSNVLFI
jgi:hypothetical protein